MSNRSIGERIAAAMESLVVSHRLGAPVKASQIQVVDSPEGPVAVKINGAMVSGKFVPRGDN